MQTVESFSPRVFTCSLWCFSLTFTRSSLAAFWQEAAGGCQCHARPWPLSVQAHHHARTGKVKASWQQRLIIIITSDQHVSTFLLNESFRVDALTLYRPITFLLTHPSLCCRSLSSSHSVSAPTFSRPLPPPPPLPHLAPSWMKSHFGG